jgi:hypothetical protein
MSPRLFFPALAAALAGLAASTAWADATVPAPVAEALERGLAIPGARLVATDYRASSGCAPREAALARSIEGSGRYALKLGGAGCGGWAWVKLEVWGKVALTARPLRAGDSLEDALVLEEREIRPGRSAFQPAPGATAARALPAGRLLTPADVRGGEGERPARGQIKVVVRTGAVVLEQTGRLVPCGRGHTCAVLPSGKHLEGRLEGDRLLVEVP